MSAVRKCENDFTQNVNEILPYENKYESGFKELTYQTLIKIVLVSIQSSM